MSESNAETNRGWILLIGGAGYIGSVLARKLLARDRKVRVLDALLYDNQASIAELLGVPGFEFVHGDLCDPEAARRCLEGVEEVVLLAALVGDPICRKYPDLAVSINDKGTIRFFDSLGGYGVRRFIFMSTCSNYGLRSSDDEATEEVALHPRSLYAETKVAVERHILGAPARADFHPTILRAATAYGLSPRMRFDLTVNEFAAELALGRELEVYDADTWRPYCHVDDVADAIIAVLDARAGRVSGEVFNVGASGENYTKRMIVDLLTERFPGARVRYRPGSVDPRNYRVSFRKLASRLGCACRFRIPDGIDQIIAAIRDNRFRDLAARGDEFGNHRIMR